MVSKAWYVMAFVLYLMVQLTQNKKEGLHFQTPNIPLCSISKHEIPSFAFHTFE